MRLLIVSNRLPVSVAKEEGELVLRRGAGGLVSGLSAYLDSLSGPAAAEQGYVWIGWPGMAVRDKAKAKVAESLSKEHHAYPVFISEQAMERFYLGFCNRTIWPLFHYFPSYTSYPEDYWQEYVAVNKTFRDAVVAVAQPDDVIWVHDYHLMLLPLLLREQLPAARIGFFLHIPFPSYEIFRLLPNRWRAEILRGLLAANVVGFHTEDYTRYFSRCVERILGYEPDGKGQLLVDGRRVRAQTFPMGVDLPRYEKEASSPEVLAQVQELRSTLAPCKVVLSIDRLDYSKGIFNRLRAFEALLVKNPEWRGRVVLVLIVVPSRVGVEEYQRTKRNVDELVGQINGAHSTLSWTPIHYRYTFLPFRELVGIYAASDVALVTPLRDGMNLIAKEYLSARPDGKGVLILSETAGAADELREALIVNANDLEGQVDALRQALAMPEEEQIRRNRTMREHLARYDIVHWASSFRRALAGLPAVI
ncbi:MAG: bifunctional alpha,alpha-trehalose-phosphate synthase (UDP-forming)/trehalose-phosphatase [Chloroflexota bacterium]